MVYCEELPYVSNDLSNAEEIWKIISEATAEKKIYFKYEPMIHCIPKLC